MIEYGKRRLNQNNARAQNASRVSNELINVVAMASAAAAAAAALGSPIGIPNSPTPVDDSKPDSETNLAAKQDAAQADGAGEKANRPVISVTSEPSVDSDASKMATSAKISCRETLQLFQELTAANSTVSSMYAKTSKTCSNLSANPVGSHINPQRCSLDIELGLNMIGEDSRGLTTDVLGLPLNMGASLNNNASTLMPDLMMANLARKEEICRDLIKNSHLSDKDMLILDALDNIYREW